MKKINGTSVAEIALGVLIALAVMQLAGWAISKFTEDSYDDDYYDDEDEYYEDEDEMV